ncbi:hypothetical protein ASC61_03150 [Aeromicrobium sp. Root344]|uniref:cupredoxin domain-containing protein n=1 Tax=Aeromicrobium sp. Root344 TaxID=1736521 RepID=UPI0006F26EFD|nr:cupredoxin family copper-binding protein [Aeromicrobium sp. Root344]KQV74084.1 hypothetical protein ASC61_03150 [Aeromicrobium sp. Root344]
MTSTTSRTDTHPTPKRWGLMALVIGGVLTAIVSVAGLSAGASESSDTLSASAATTKAKAAAASATAASAATATSTTTKAAVTKQVMIENYKFTPASLTVAVGDTVKWTNMDTAPHTVTVTSGPVKFNSGNLSKGQSFSYTFKTPGTYSYYCAVHPDMTAKVTVTGSGTTPTPTPTTPTPKPTDTPTPTPTPTMPPMGGGDDVCTGLDSTVNVFLQHLYAAHLETSVGQQVTDALSLDQYLKTHLVLVENMLKPLLGGVQSTLDTFLQHVYAAHLETGVGQQVTDALAINQYVKTHTVLVENMIKPLVGEDLSSC